MAWTTPMTFTAGNALLAAQLNEQLRDNTNYLHDVFTLYNMTSSGTPRSITPALAGVRLYKLSDQTIADSTFTNIGFAAEAFDTANSAAASFHNTSTNTDRITIPSGMDGYYLVGASVSFAANTTGSRRVRIDHSTAGVIAADTRLPVSGTLTQMSASALWYFAAGDYAYVEVQQSSGGNLAIDGTTNTYIPAFW